MERHPLSLWGSDPTCNERGGGSRRRGRNERDRGVKKEERGSTQRGGGAEGGQRKRENIETETVVNRESSKY